MVGVTTTCPELGHIRATLLPHIDHTVWWKCGGAESIGIVSSLYLLHGVAAIVACCADHIVYSLRDYRLCEKCSTPRPLQYREPANLMPINAYKCLYSKEHNEVSIPVCGGMHLDA